MITDSFYHTGQLFIQRQAAIELCIQHDFRAEDCFLDDLELRGNPWELLPIAKPSWNGQHSAKTYETVLPKVLRRTVGTATIWFFWNGGEMRTELTVVDGRFVKRKKKGA